VSEKGSGESFAPAKAALDSQSIPTEFGGHSDRVFETDTLVLSPGVPSGIPVVQESIRRSIDVVSEVEVASWFCPAPIVAVTGTNGKTTTTTLIGRMYADARRAVAVGGNIGVAFSEIVDSVTSESTVVLEISSFQLDHIRTFRPRVAVLLNITPDHLDRYDHSFGKYTDAKARVFMNQAAGDTAIYNYDDPVSRSTVEKRVGPGVQLLPFSSEESLRSGSFLRGEDVVCAVKEEQRTVIARKEISIKGKHNLYNAMASVLAAQAGHISLASIRNTLRNFRGVEHRLEFVREWKGVTYVNDSKATNVDSVWYALQSFTAPLVLLLGGRDKGNDYARLVPLVRQHVHTIVAIGESAEKVCQAFQDIVTVRRAGSMEEAVRLATAVATPGDIVLLSPACASFDWFDNYEHRGRAFKQLVHQIGS
jgi:UDP-N-acetylmuramoylalanine--D-glutamate ligase